MTEQNGSGRGDYLVLVWSPEGYSLREASGELPRVGIELEVDGRRLVVTRVGASPLPDDDRVCAYSIGA